MKYSGSTLPCVVAYVLVVLAVTGCQLDSKSVTPLDAYQHVTKPVVFAPELAIKENTYKGCFSKDFTEFYFFRENKNNSGRADYRIFSSLYAQGKWSEPQLIGFSDSASNVYPLVSVVDDKFFFTSYRRVPSDTSRKTNANLWVTRKTETGWEKPIHFDAANLIHNYNSQPSMAKNGTIYFTSNVPDWSRTLTYKMKFQNGNYSEPETVEFVNNLRQTDSMHTYWEICIAPDEDYMIMTISEKGKEPKLYIAHAKDNRWTTPVYLGDIIHEDVSGNFPYLTADGKYLIFTKAFSQFYILPTKVFLEEKHSADRK